MSWFCWVLGVEFGRTHFCIHVITHCSEAGTVKWVGWLEYRYRYDDEYRTRFWIHVIRSSGVTYDVYPRFGEMTSWGRVSMRRHAPRNQPTRAFAFGEVFLSNFVCAILIFFVVVFYWFCFTPILYKYNTKYSHVHMHNTQPTCDTFIEAYILVYIHRLIDWLKTRIHTAVVVDFRRLQLVSIIDTVIQFPSCRRNSIDLSDKNHLK